MRTVLSILSVAVVMTASPTLAQRADPACFPTKIIKKVAEREHGEIPVWEGIAANGRLLEMLVNKKTGAWTLLSTGPNHISCIVATGTESEAVEPKIPEQPS